MSILRETYRSRLSKEPRSLLNSPNFTPTLTDWLTYLEGLHPKSIEMGLERVRIVYQRLCLSLECPIITVGGTNGKGSTTAFLANILGADGYRVGLYQSPHLFRYNERIQIQQQTVSDADLIDAFQAIETARLHPPAVSLTYFEFGTLAAFWLFAQQKPALEAIVLEVGMGGRLDAVNLLDPDCTIITSIDLDHQEYLGNTREAIGWEKSHLLRKSRPGICADANPPQSLIDYAEQNQVPMQYLGKDFGYQPNPINQSRQWQYWRRLQKNAEHPKPPNPPETKAATYQHRFSLPYPALAGRHQLANASAAITALESLADRLPISQQAIKKGLLQTFIPGRFQILPGRPTIILDVAHNPQAAQVLADTLSEMAFFPKTLAVFGMLHDKDIHTVIRLLQKQIDGWLVTDLPGPRGLAAQQIREFLLAQSVPESHISCYPNAAAATEMAIKTAQDTDRIIIFGSFLTVATAAPALPQLSTIQ